MINKSKSNTNKNTKLAIVKLAEEKTSKSIKSKRARSISESAIETIDTRFPRMFSDEFAQERLAQAQAITDLKNLGPSSEKEFHRAGIRTAPQFIRLGWQKAFRRLVKANPRNCHSIFVYALIGALQNKEWNRLSEEDKKLARELCAKLRAELSQKRQK